MDTETCETLASSMEERAAFYRLLASLFFKEVSDEFIERLRELPSELAQEPGALGEGFAELRSFLARKGPDPRTDLACDYARVFLAAGMFTGDAACPFESIYTSEEGLVMQEARDEVRALYAAHGMQVDEALHLPEDHLSFELEFVAVLSDRAADLATRGEGDAVRENAAVQLAFVEGHLENWLGDLEERVCALARFKFYPALMRITRGYVEQDRLFLEELVTL